MPSTTVSKAPLPSPAELRRIEAVLAFVFNEFEGLQTAFAAAENASEAAFKQARRENATTEEAIARAAEAQTAAQHVLDDRAAGQLFMFLFNVRDDLKRIDEMARQLIDRVQVARNDNPEGYNISARIEIQETLAKLAVGGDDA